MGTFRISWVCLYRDDLCFMCQFFCLPLPHDQKTEGLRWISNPTLTPPTAAKCIKFNYIKFNYNVYFTDTLCNRVNCDQEHQK